VFDRLVLLVGGYGSVVLVLLLLVARS